MVFVLLFATPQRVIFPILCGFSPNITHIMRGLGLIRRHIRPIPEGAHDNALLLVVRFIPLVLLLPA